MSNYKEYVEKYNLQAHPEGGFYKETYLAENKVTLDDGRVRNLSSNILFLLTANNPSNFHRLLADELWFYHGGNSLVIHMLLPTGEYKQVALGLGEDEVVQYTVPAGVIFGSTVKGEGEDFSLVGCVVTPAFHFDDFQLFTAEELIKQYPNEEKIIRELTIN